MQFFSTENPFLFVLGMILLIAVLKGLFSKMDFFKASGRKTYIVPLILMIAVLAVLYRPIISIFAGAASMASVILVFLVFIFFVFVAFGTPVKMAFSSVKEIGFLKLTLIVAVFCIFALSVSQVFGERLLDEPKVSFSDAFTQETGHDGLDLSPFFTPGFLGAALLVVILGMFLFYINLG